MCGIVGYIGSHDAQEIIISGLEKLEYRGYDSAGISVYRDGELQVTRAEGKLQRLKDQLAAQTNAAQAHLGIGHTRWATHGRPSETNAHPHTAGRVSLIHNGIIENYIELREKLIEEGCEFKSETDTEIAAHLLNKFLESGLEPFDALKKVCEQVRGSYAFLALDSNHPDRILVAKNATPIVIGEGEGEAIVASDIPAVLGTTRRIRILEDGDIAEVSSDSIRIESSQGPVERPVETITWDPITAQKGGFKHYMLKEIYEQPTVLGETFRGRLKIEEGEVWLPEIKLSDQEISEINRVVLLACGTAWHAALITKFYLEGFTRLPCEVDYGSEYRYRNPVFDEHTLVGAISQSGETADTIASLEKVRGVTKTFAICNVLGSSVTRKVDNVLYTYAGPEISVASTKAFTTQLIAAYLWAAYLGQRRGTLNKSRVSELMSDLVHLPAAVDEALKSSSAIEDIAKRFHAAHDFLYLGRGNCYPIALEGALKLKEISYIHAEGYPAGEMKHGPIALIDEKMPVVVVIQRSDVHFEKSLSNLREVESRGGRIIAVTDTEGHKELHDVAEQVIEVPYVSSELSPILLTVPLQLLAYYVAVANGTDVDLPRNLAKSVTVE